MERINEDRVSSESEECTIGMGAAAWVVSQRSIECDSDGRLYSSAEEITAAITALRERGEWPEPAEGLPVVGRALMNRRRAALWGEGIVMRAFWL